MTKKAYVYSGVGKNANIEVKAYKKANAVKAIKKMDSSIKESAIKRTTKQNSHQVPVDEPED